MNAFVAPPAPNGTRSANADWMELQAIRSAGRRSTIGDLLGIIDLIEDQAATVGPFDEETGETLDESILETHRNRPVDAVFGELAAGGYTAGEVVSFGFPRPTGTAFLPALRATYERFGAGTVKKSVPPGFPVATKDDVDRIGQFHGWFSEQPARHWLPSMFIPFTLHSELADDATATFDQTLANRFLREEARYGIVFDRLRVAHVASACLQANGDVPSRVDGRDRFGEVEAWVETTLAIPGLVESA